MSITIQRAVNLQIYIKSTLLFQVKIKYLNEFSECEIKRVVSKNI